MWSFSWWNPCYARWTLYRLYLILTQIWLPRFISELGYSIFLPDCFYAWLNAQTNNNLDGFMACLKFWLVSCSLSSFTVQFPSWHYKLWWACFNTMTSILQIPEIKLNFSLEKTNNVTKLHCLLFHYQHLWGRLVWINFIGIDNRQNQSGVLRFTFSVSTHIVTCGLIHTVWA